MIGIYLFQRFLNKKSDYDFERYWEDKFVPRQRNYWFIALIYFFFMIGIISELLLYNTSSFIIGFLVIVFVAIIYGGYFVRSVLRFIAINNSRYMSIKTGMQFQNTNSFNKDNVVG